MITEVQLLDMLSNLEADYIERTISTANMDKFCQAICAFANDLPDHRRPGYLLIGVHDDGMISGLKVTDELLKILGGIRSDGNVLPQPLMNVSRFALNGGDVA
ncbi:MAG: helix-turn-helix domain-containing protein, partial [Desulfatirhabdiaceae bacterium]